MASHGCKLDAARALRSASLMNNPSELSRNQLALINLFKELNAHALYPVESMERWLLACGVPADIDYTTDNLLTFNESIGQVEGDWGRGIYPPHVLNSALRYYGLDEQIRTEMTGRGFAYSDLIDQLSTTWGHRE